MTTRLRIGLIIGALLLIGGIGLVFWLRSRGLESARNSLEQAQQQVEAVKETCKEGDSACLNTVVTDAAEEFKSSAACKELAGEAADNCVWTVARSSNDEAVCAEIVNSEWSVRCHDGILLSKAMSSKDPSVCSRITSVPQKDQCLAAIDPITAQNCSSRGKSVEECAELQSYETAIASGDYSACAQFSGERKDSCIDVTAESDPDADGLSGADEARYGTSNQKPDTDGDGFTDGDEVAGGFNPNGPGKL